LKRKDIENQIFIALGVKVLYCIIDMMICKLRVIAGNSRPKISKSLRNAIWVKHCGKVFEHKCNVSFCNNIINPFTFVAGHDIPHSRGGTTDVNNLIPICDCCNSSMTNVYTIKEFSSIFGQGIIHFP
jgi:hypothetical protein